MSTDLHATALLPRSALGSGIGSGDGSAIGTPLRDVFQDTGLGIAEEVLLPVHSLRRSRVARDEAWLADTLASVGLEVPARPRLQTGGEHLACVHIEPHAWLVTGQVDLPQTGAGWWQTELTDRCCAFRLRGARALEVLSAGGDLHGVLPGMGCRLSFAEMTVVTIQCFSAHDYRVIVDTSLGLVLSQWLVDAAGNLSPAEERACTP